MDIQDHHFGRPNEVTTVNQQSQSVKQKVNVLNRMPQNPFTNHSKENVLLNGSSNGTQASGSQITQITVSEVSGIATNPFFTQCKDSSDNTVSRYNNKDLSEHGQNNRCSHFPATSTPSLENGWAVSPPTLSQATKQFTFHSQSTVNISPTGISNQKTNIFEPFKEETSVSHRMMANEETSEERDYLLEYILANQKNDEKPNQLDGFEDVPSLLPPEIISDDIFTSSAASQSSDIFQTPGSTVQNRVLQNIQFFQTFTSVQNDNSHLSGNTPLNNGQFKPQGSHTDKTFMSTEQSNVVFQETSRFPPLLNASTDGGLMFRRRPPKPAPRSKAPKNRNQIIHQDTPIISIPAEQNPAQIQFMPTLATPIPTSVMPQATNNIQDTMEADDVKQGKVYEDVFFIGEEKCVEDWPEDSPELSPDWKPTGKLKLRRESFMIAEESETALNAHSLGKKSRRTKMKLSISRRGSKAKSTDDPSIFQNGTVQQESKEKYSDSWNDAYFDTMPWVTKFHASDEVFLPEQEEPSSPVNKSIKNKKTKFTVPHLLYRGSKKKSHIEDYENESPFLQGTKSELIHESYEDNVIKCKQKEPVMKDCRPKEQMKFKDSLSKQLSKDDIENDLKKMNGLSVLEESKEYSPVKDEDENHNFPANILQEYQHESFSPKSPDSNGKKQELQECKPKRSIKFTVPHLPRKGSKSTQGNDSPLSAESSKTNDIKGLEINVIEDYCEMRKSPVHKGSPVIQRDSKGLDAEKGADLFKAGDLFQDADNDWMEKHTTDSKTEKLKDGYKPHNKSNVKAKDQVIFPEDVKPPGATSGDYYLSEAAKAEWMSSQMDVRRARALDEDEDLKNEEEGDTDSLMEWWNTVELWDELPEDVPSIKEDETKSFTEIADKVHHGLRVFYKIFTEQAEVLYQHILQLYAIGDDLSNFHRRMKIANITGGTTTAVGGVAAIAGLALVPATFGASLLLSAVGLGIATAGGITAASASISDNVHDMNDRKKIEVVVQDYETRLAELRRCLCFVAEGVRRLRFHPLLRRNNYFAGDWEVRKALQTISLVGNPVEQAEGVVEKSTMALNRVCKGMDNYFCKDSKELKKGCKKEVTTQVNMLATQLHEGLVALNSIREQLMEATGYM